MSFRIEHESWGTQLVKHVTNLADWLAELPDGESTVTWIRDGRRPVERALFRLNFALNEAAESRAARVERRIGLAMETWIRQSADQLPPGIADRLQLAVRGTIHASVEYYGLLDTLVQLESVNIDEMPRTQLVAAVVAHRSTPCSCCGQLPAWLLDHCLEVGLDYRSARRCVSATVYRD